MVRAVVARTLLRRGSCRPWASAWGSDCWDGRLLPAAVRVWFWGSAEGPPLFPARNELRMWSHDTDSGLACCERKPSDKPKPGGETTPRVLALNKRY